MLATATVGGVSCHVYESQPNPAKWCDGVATVVLTVVTVTYPSTTFAPSATMLVVRRGAGTGGGTKTVDPYNDELRFQPIRAGGYSQADISGMRQASDQLMQSPPGLVDRL